MRYAFAILSVVLIAANAQAAGIKACWDATSLSPDAVAVQLYGGGVLIGESAPAGACITIPLPTNFPRNVDTPMTVAAKNSLGEVGPTSNVVTFRAAAIPGQLTGVTISGVVGP